MVKKALVIGLLGISILALVWSEASAKVCVVKGAGGACLLWSGSLECGIVATGVGNVIKDPVALGCEASATDLKQWVVGCGNPGSNTLMAPGVNTVYFEGGLSGEMQLLPEQVDKNGKATVSVFAKPSSGLLDAIQEANPDICPNPNWSVNDAVPCDVHLRDVELDENNCVTADAYFDCYLPDCSTLDIDRKTKSFERRQYICSQTSTQTYRIPLCPQP
jgi:hypothetical protein